MLEPFVQENSPTRLIHSGHVSWSVGADRTITVKDTISQWFYPLNDVASLIWDLLDGANDITAIIHALTAAFEVDEATARADVEHFIADACDFGLVHPVPEHPKDASVIPLSS